MGAYDLPGPGDVATWGAVKSPRDPRYIEREEADDNEPTVDERLESVLEARDWIEAAHTALQQLNLKRHFECLNEALEIIKSLEALES